MNFMPVCSALQPNLNEKMENSLVINFDDCIMENICVRFPHLLEQINRLLDNNSLIKCKEVSRTMSSIIDDQESGTFLTKRVIHRYIKNYKEFAEEWKVVLKKLPIKRLNVFGILVKDFYKAVPSRHRFQWSPLHIAAERGDINFCKLIAKLGTIKSNKWSPLHFSAQAGHVEVFEFLYKKFKDKQHGGISGFLQHLTAKNGHLEIFKFLHEKSNEINPIMEKQITPMHLAAQYGQYNICKYICDNTVLVNTLRSDGNTPLTLAIHRGHIKIAILLHKKDRPMLRIARILLYICMAFFIFHCIFLGMLKSPYSWLLILVICYSTLNMFWYILNDIRFCLWASPKLDY